MTSPPPPPAEGQQSGRRVAWLRLGIILLFLAAWEGVAALGWIRPIFISSPSHILQAAIRMAGAGLWRDLAVSGMEFLIGMGLAVLLGMLLGIVLGWYSTLGKAIDPFLTGLYATPRVALIPIIILWLGIGIASKVAVVFLGAVFPILLSTMAGVRAVDNDLVTCARSFGATDRQVFRTLALPSSVPFIIAGLQLGVGRGLVGVVVAEFIAARAGVGHMMSVAAATFQSDKTYVGILILAGTGVLLSWLLGRLQANFDRWRPTR